MMRIFTDSRSSAHQTPPGFPECPERLDSILRHLRVGSWELVDPSNSGVALHVDVEAALAAVHDGAYIERFRRAVVRGDGLLDSADNPLSAGTWDTAFGAVEVALAAAEWVMAEEPLDAGGDRSAFVATRPPGHHAERATAMGFCYFNQVAVVAEHLVRHHGLERVAIFDFDVHHGNGTQHLFEDRADVVFVSTHQFPFYPGTGAAEQKGTGDGRGATLNVPLPAGTDDEGYARAIEGEVLPFLRRAEPQILLVSAGFDAWKGDPLGGMRLSVDGYAHWGALLREFAAEVCGGRSVSILEGGYDVHHLPRLVERYLEGLSGRV